MCWPESRLTEPIGWPRSSCGGSGPGSAQRHQQHWAEVWHRHWWPPSQLAYSAYSHSGRCRERNGEKQNANTPPSNAAGGLAWGELEAHKYCTTRWEVRAVVFLGGAGPNSLSGCAGLGLPADKRPFARNAGTGNDVHLGCLAKKSKKAGRALRCATVRCAPHRTRLRGRASYKQRTTVARAGAAPRQAAQHRRPDAMCASMRCSWMHRRPKTGLGVVRPHRKSLQCLRWCVRVSQGGASPSSASMAAGGAGGTHHT